MVNKISTIKDIARLAGVSIGSVDRALHGRYGIKESTRKKILNVIEQNGYEVNELASSLSKRKSIRIAFVTTQAYYGEFYSDVQRGALAAASQLKDFGVEVIPLFSDDFDKEAEKNILEELFSQNIQGIILCPFHENELDEIINKFADTGVPVVTVATDAPMSKRLACVSTDSYKNGELAAQIMILLTGGKGKIIAISGFKSITDHEHKMQGFCTYIAKNAPSIDIIGAFHTYQNESEIYNITSSMLSSHVDLAGIYIATSSSKGACKAVEDSHRGGQVKLVSTDLHQEVRDYMNKGIINASIFQDPFRQGYLSAQILFDYISKGKLAKGTNYIRPEIVLPGSISLFD